MRKQDKKKTVVKKSKKASLQLKPLSATESKAVTAGGPIGLGGYAN